MTQATDTDIRELRDLMLGLDKKIDGLEASLDKKIDGLDKKLEVFQARTEERFNSIDQRFAGIDQRFGALEDQMSDTRTQIRAQDTRLWSFIAGLSIAIIGLLSKLAFFRKLNSHIPSPSPYQLKTFFNC